MGCFGVLMCLGTSANGEACFPCGCKTQTRHITTATTVGLNPIQGVGDNALYLLTFAECFEATQVGTPIQIGGDCGVDSSTNYCAGCIRDVEDGVTVIKAEYDQGCPSSLSSSLLLTLLLLFWLSLLLFVLLLLLLLLPSF